MDNKNLIDKATEILLDRGWTKGVLIDKNDKCCPLGALALSVNTPKIKPLNIIRLLFRTDLRLAQAFASAVPCKFILGDLNVTIDYLINDIFEMNDKKFTSMVDAIEYLLRVKSKL